MSADPLSLSKAYCRSSTTRTSLAWLKPSLPLCIDISLQALSTCPSSLFHPPLTARHPLFLGLTTMSPHLLLSATLSMPPQDTREVTYLHFSRLPANFKNVLCVCFFCPLISISHTAITDLGHLVDWKKDLPRSASSSSFKRNRERRCKIGFDEPTWKVTNLRGTKFQLGFGVMLKLH